MKIIITEEQSLYLRRRFAIIDDLIKYVLYSRDNSEFYSMSVDEFEEEVCWLIYDLLDEEGHNVDSFETEELFDYLKRYGKEIRKQHRKFRK